MVIVGCDPGLSGALAFIDTDMPEASSIDVFDMPTVDVVRGGKKRKDVNYVELGRLLKGGGQCFIERVGSMPGQGVSSSFAFGKSAGAVYGAAAACGWSIQDVSSQAWKKHFGLIGKEKDEARLLAIKLFPFMANSLDRKKDCGRADSLLIAEYGRCQLK